MKLKVEFKNTAVEDEISMNGFIHIPCFLNEKEVKELLNLYQKLYTHPLEKKSMWNSLFDLSTEEANLTSSQIINIITPKLSKLFIEYTTPVASFMSKNQEVTQLCELHRDFSIIDEEHF